MQEPNKPDNSISDFLKSMTDRLTSPFIFSFCISFFIINFEGVLYLYLSDAKYKEKIRVFFELIGIENTNPFLNFIYVTWIPFFTALFYTIIWPFINQLFKAVRAKAEVWKSESIESTLRKKSASQNEIANFLDEEERLKNRIEELQTKNRQYSSEMREISQDLNDAKIRLMNQNDQYGTASKNPTEEQLEEATGVNDSFSPMDKDNTYNILKGEKNNHSEMENNEENTIRPPTLQSKTKIPLAMKFTDDELNRISKQTGVIDSNFKGVINRILSDKIDLLNLTSSNDNYLKGISYIYDDYMSFAIEELYKFGTSEKFRNAIFNRLVSFNIPVIQKENTDYPALSIELALQLINTKPKDLIHFYLNITDIVNSIILDTISSDNTIDSDKSDSKTKSKNYYRNRLSHIAKNYIQTNPLHNCEIFSRGELL